MSKGRMILGGAALAATAGALGAFAATGIGGSDGTGFDHRSAGAVPIEVDVAATRAARAAQPARATRRGVTFTHFITRNPIAVPPDQSIFVRLKCPRRKGQPLHGGIVTNGDPLVNPSVLSRFHPVTLRSPRNAYFVAASNEAGNVPGSFFATFVCVK